MCLAVIDEVPMSGVEEAYKVFNEMESRLNGAYCDFNFKKRRWITDTNSGPICTHVLSDEDEPITYPSGFHCYIDKDYAINITARCNIRKCHRVLVRNIVASGFQLYACRKESKVVVARQIFIMEEITR